MKHDGRVVSLLSPMLTGFRTGAATSRDQERKAPGGGPAATHGAVLGGEPAGTRGCAFDSARSREW